MSTFALAWDEFLQVVDEVRALNERGAEPHMIAELVRYARELLNIIEAEISEQSTTVPSDAEVVLAQLRSRLESLERDLSPSMP